MGRTIHYSLFGKEQLSLAMRREIELAAHMLRHHFSWRCENFRIELSEYMQITYSDSLLPIGEQPWAPRLGTGMIKVADDEWSSCLILTFVQWVSSRLPTVTVRVHDEGEYVLAGYLLYQNGVPMLDLVNIGRSREKLKSYEFKDELARLDKAEQQAARGIFFADVKAKDYADRPEITALGLTEEELAKITLKDVAIALQMPWDTEWLKAGA